MNTALYLRRPLLITGPPGSGKSSLIYAVAQELRLGPVLRWPITSRSTLQDGLYGYDAIGLLQATNLRRFDPEALSPIEIGEYVKLGPLGSALVPAFRPRALLIDEIDKGDIDLPNDLLNVFEDGEFTIPQLERLPPQQEQVEVRTSDAGIKVPVHRGQVRCHEFPFVVLTSNGERDFPPPFLRRCLRLDISPPNQEQLTSIVEAHLGEDARLRADRSIVEFLNRREQGQMATDQLLNAAYFISLGIDPHLDENHLLDTLFRHIGSADNR